MEACDSRNANEVSEPLFECFFLSYVCVWQGGMAIGMQTTGMQFLGQPQFMGMRPAGPQYTADMQKQMAEEHQ